MPDRETLLEVLDLARWAPSGDNTQPWRFEIVADDHVAIHGFDTRDRVLYDFEGHPSHMAHGALLETLRVAATGYGLAAEWTLRPGSSDVRPVYDVLLTEQAGRARDPLFPHIRPRVVQRRPMRMTPLSVEQRGALAEAPGDGYRVQFFETFTARLDVARLLWDNAYIRLTCPEAFEVHRDIIEWGARFSNDRIPERAVGVDPATAKLMKWVMTSWSRVEFFNRYLLGTVPPRIQLDFVPALACAAHLLMRPLQPLAGVPDYVRAGVALQRLWLTATSLGLHLQPEMTPVIFRWYARAGARLSAVQEIDVRVRALADRFEVLASAEASDPFAFFCRVGVSAAPTARSNRLSLSELIVGERPAGRA